MHRYPSAGYLGRHDHASTVAESFAFCLCVRVRVRACVWVHA